MEKEDYRDQSEIDEWYTECVDDYKAEKDNETKDQMRKYFMDWFWVNEWRLTDAEKEYLQDNIWRVRQS